MPSDVQNPNASVAHLAMGGNVGDVPATFRSALVRMRDAGIEVTRASSLYKTAPVGPVAQDDFRNAVVEVRTTRAPRELLAAMLEIERAAGRDRSREQRWGPRTLDLDMLLYGEERIQTPELTVPHPRLTERLFVLAPLAEIAPGLVVAGETIETWRDRRAREQGAGVVAVDAEWWHCS